MGNRALVSGLVIGVAAWSACQVATAAQPASAPAASAPATSAPAASEPTTSAATAPAVVEPTVQPKYVLPKGPTLKPVAPRPEVTPTPPEPATGPATTAPATTMPAPATRPGPATQPATHPTTAPTTRPGPATVPAATAPATTAPAATTPATPTTKPPVPTATGPTTGPSTTTAPSTTAPSATAPSATAIAPAAGRPLWTDRTRAAARQAARALALRQLARQIADVRVGPDQPIKFLAEESEDLRCALEVVLACVPDAAEPKYRSDGQCEVTLAASPRAMEADIRLALTRYYKGTKLTPADAARLPIEGFKALSATGRAAAPPAPAEGEMIPVEGTAPVAVPPQAARFWGAHCTVHGRLAAERAAREDALRHLAVRVGALTAGPAAADGTSDRATVADLIAASDEPNVDVRKFVRGANLTGVRYHTDELVVEVRMAVGLRTVYATLRSWAQAHLRNQRDLVRRLEELAVKADNSPVQDTGLGTPPVDQIKNITAEMKRAAALGAASPAWASQTVRSIGQARPAADIDAGSRERALQAAWHAAEIDARIRLARHLAGLPVAGGPALHDLAARNDDFAAAMLGFQQSAVMPPEFRKIRPDGMAELAIEVDLRPLWQAVIRCQARAE